MAWPIDPIIFKVGSFQLTWYALVYIIGFIVCTIALSKASKRKEINLKQSEVYDFVIILVIGMLIGARLFHIVFWDLSYFTNNPSEILRIWKGGMSFHGGLLGMLLISIYYSKKKKIDFFKLADILVLPAALFLALARIANYINHEILGTITSSGWCVEFPGVSGCRHPVQLYAAAGKLALFFLLLYLKKKKHNIKSGFLFAIFLTLLGLGRFFLDFIREDIHYLGLSSGQWFSAIMIIVGTTILIRLSKKN